MSENKVIPFSEYSVNNWIPVSEGFPLPYFAVLVSATVFTSFGKCIKCVEMDHIDESGNFGVSWRYDVEAWRYAPLPYSGVSEH